MTQGTTSDLCVALERSQKFSFVCKSKRREGGIFQDLLNLREIVPSHSNLSFSRRKLNNFDAGAKRKQASWEGEDRTGKDMFSKNSQSLCKECLNNGQEEKIKNTSGEVSGKT